MSEINQIRCIGTEDPEFYAEILKNTFKAAYWRQPSDERPCPDIPSIQNVDSQLSRSLQTLLDVVANISLRRRGNVSATMGCVKDNKGTLETQLYIVFNHEKDDAARSCSQHLRTIFDMLSCVPYKPSEVDHSPKIISNELIPNLIDICRAIHNHSFEIFERRVNKRKEKFSDIRSYIEQDQTQFTRNQHSILMNFFRDVDAIIKAVNAATKRQLTKGRIEMLLGIYSYWTENNLLPKDTHPDIRAVTLLDSVDTWLADAHGIKFQLRRWALKIMSFVISANRIFTLTQSRRFRSLLQGKFRVQVLPSSPTIPFRYTLSLETIQVAINAALHGTVFLSEDWDERRTSFIEELVDASEVVQEKTTVHAELALIMAMAKGEIKDVFLHRHLETFLHHVQPLHPRLQ